MVLEREYMMKIVWLMPECPFPANTGGRVVEWNRIKELAKNNDIYLFVIVDGRDEFQYMEQLQKLCKEVHFYLRGRSPALLLKSLIYPYPAVSRWSSKMRSDIEECYKSIHPDVVMVEFPQMIGNLSKLIRNEAQIVVNQHNIEHLSMVSIAGHINKPLKRVIYKIVSNQLKKYERVQYKKLNVLIYTFVSKSDKEYFEKEYGLNNTLLVPPGAWVQDIKPASDSKKLLFVAKMTYEPNETGAVWFVENIWDNIKKKIPDAELFLVGKDPTEKLIACCKNHSGITVTGTVDSVEPYYEQSAVVIVPILSGGGVKVKLIEGLGHGKVIVTTNKGIEGTDFVNGTHVLAADSPELFGDICADVIGNPGKYDEIRLAANQLMKRKYSWQGIMGMFENVLRESLK